MNSTRHPTPAPLPYASQAGRGDIPPAPPTKPTNPGGPVLREDEVTLLACTLMIVVFVALMVVVSLIGGL
ncbi:MAG: hypothetical protein ACI39C_07270 [Dietzia sp.]